MSQTLARYQDNLEYFPKEERKALEQITLTEGEVENVALSVIRQINRSKETLKRVR